MSVESIHDLRIRFETKVYDEGSINHPRLLPEIGNKTWSHLRCYTYIVILPCVQGVY